MKPWKLFKNGYDAWEQAANPLFEAWLKSPSVVGPAGSALTGAAKLHALQRRMLDTWWSSFGLPTRSDQERSLHAMHQLQSRLIDLEEKLQDMGKQP